MTLTMTLKSTLKVATDAVKTAFKTALDDPTITKNNLSELWRHYQGLSAMHDSIITTDTVTFSVPNSPYEVGSFFGGGILGGMGDDVISFGTVAGGISASAGDSGAAGVAMPTPDVVRFS